MLGLRAVRDESEIFVTKAWQRFCGTVSDRTTKMYSLDENRRCFRSGGQAGFDSDSACGTFFATFLTVFFLLYPLVAWPNYRRSGKNYCSARTEGAASAFAGICALSYQYDYHFDRTFSSICLSLLYAEFGCLMDITDSHTENDSAHSLIDMTTIIWIFN